MSDKSGTPNMPTVVALLEYMADGPCHCDDTGHCIFCDARKLLPTAKADESRLRAAEKCVEALRESMPAIEQWENDKLVGDEGCLWPVENLRVALSTYDQECGKGAADV